MKSVQYSIVYSKKKKRKWHNRLTWKYTDNNYKMMIWIRFRNAILYRKQIAIPSDIFKKNGICDWVHPGALLFSNKGRI